MSCRSGFVLALLVAALGINSVAHGQTKLPTSGRTEVSAMARNRVAKIAVTTAKNESTAGKASWVVTDLEISVNGQQLFVPRSVYADLDEPNTILVRSEGSQFVAMIRGLDGADSYETRVFFDATRVVRRAVYNIVPQPTEETRYWNRVVN